MHVTRKLIDSPIRVVSRSRDNPAVRTGLGSAKTRPSGAVRSSACAVNARRVGGSRERAPGQRREAGKSGPYSAVQCGRRTWRRRKAATRRRARRHAGVVPGCGPRRAPAGLWPAEALRSVACGSAGCRWCATGGRAYAYAYAHHHTATAFPAAQAAGRRDLPG